MGLSNQELANDSQSDEIFKENFDTNKSKRSGLKGALKR